jgi:hypothetical protein
MTGRQAELQMSKDMPALSQYWSPHPSAPLASPALHLLSGVLVAGLQSQGFSPPLKFLTRAIEGVVDDRKSYTLPNSYGPVSALIHEC